MKYLLKNVKMAANVDESELFGIVRQYLIKEYQLYAVDNLKIAKKSIDARHGGMPCFVYTVSFETEKKVICDANLTEMPHEYMFYPRRFLWNYPERPVVVGSGPAGLMAALTLAESGAKPIILERGGPIDDRQKAVRKFWRGGKLSELTNVQFGEGGAGMFSDGKLMTGIRKDMYVARVFKEFIEAGAPEEIMYLAKPHIGTDKLVTMTANIRQKIEAFGGEFRFYEKLVDIEIDNNAVQLIEVEKKNGTRYRISTSHLFLAIGHSARDTFQMLYDRGVHLEQKPFAVGVRIEHKQEMINIAQYGKKYYNSPYLDAADYKMAVHLDDNRTVYTFCMCPGGVVVGATSLFNHVVTNGMSEYARDKENANAALLVNVDARDFGSSHPLAGMYFQEELEKKAYLLGGENYAAPVQTVGDFLAGRATEHLGAVKPSYLPAVKPADFKELFPEHIYRALQEGIRVMGRRLRGFDTPDAVLTAVETRTSSPVRIVRDSTGQSSVRGLYPLGEGAGYAGGITSAAADGAAAWYRGLYS